MNDFNQKFLKSRRSIESFFISQCRSLKGLRDDLDDDEFCCGQFIGDDAASIKQRGLHGLAAALAVSQGFGAADVEIREGLVKSALKYSKAPHGDLKTVKLCELIIALRSLPTTEASSEALANLVSLLNGLKIENGSVTWPFVANEDAQFLPTAFALWAMYDPDEPTRVYRTKEWLLKRLKKLARDTLERDDIDVYSALFGLYVLTFKCGVIHPSDESDYKDLAIQLYLKVLPLLAEESEHNVEYWSESRSYFLRIPWQLYLFALLAKYKPRILFKSEWLSTIGDLCKNIDAQAFKYPFSGQHLSSRTHAVAYVAFADIEKGLGNISANRQAWNLFLGKFSTKFFLLFTKSTILLLILTFYIWTLLSNQLDIQGLLTEMNGGVIGFLVSWSVGVVLALKRV